MRIAVNTRLLLKDKLEGIGWFAHEILRRITRDHPEHEFIFIFDRRYDKDFIFADNIRAEVLFPPTRHPFLWYIWFEWRLPALLKKLKADAFVSPDGYIPLNLKIPVINVIHDINFLHRPTDLPLLTRRYYNHFFPRFAQKSNAIITVSEFSRQDIVENYHIQEDKVSVVYNGLRSRFKTLTEEAKQKIQNKKSDFLPFFMYIGSLHPRKNLEGILKAYDVFRKETGVEFRLLITGEAMFMTKGIRNTHKDMEFKDEVIFTGRLSDESLSLTLALAFGLLFVPFIEGFGVPPIEAMASGVPVIASDRSSLPEVCGDAALLVNPDDPREIAQSMIRIYKEKDLKEKLISKGYDNIKRFSWDKSAEEFWEIIEKSTSNAKKVL